ncbi:hypothetical protein Trydic_g14110 [Trypoxylus dichotomus]
MEDLIFGPAGRSSWPFIRDRSGVAGLLTASALEKLPDKSSTSSSVHGVRSDMMPDVPVNMVLYVRTISVHVHVWHEIFENSRSNRIGRKFVLR